MLNGWLYSEEFYSVCLLLIKRDPPIYIFLSVLQLPSRDTESDIVRLKTVVEALTKTQEALIYSLKDLSQTQETLTQTQKTLTGRQVTKQFWLSGEENKISGKSVFPKQQKVEAIV